MAKSLSSGPSFSALGDLFSKYTADVAMANVAADRGYSPQTGGLPLLFKRNNASITVS